MTLSLIVTFWSGDIHRLSEFFHKLGASAFKGIDQVVLVCSGTNFVASKANRDALGVPEACDFIVIESTARRSQATARNWGISSTTGDLIAIHDGDDFPHPHKFIIAKHIFSSVPELDWFCHDSLPSWEELAEKNYANLPMDFLKDPVAGYGKAPVFVGSRSAAADSSVVMRRSVLANLRYSEKAEDFRHEDVELMWRIFAAGFVGVFVPWPLSTYVPSQGPNSQNERSLQEFLYFSRFIDGDLESLKGYLERRGVSLP